VKRFAINLDVSGDSWNDVAENAARAKAASDKALLETGNAETLTDDLMALVITISTDGVKIEKWFVDGTYTVSKDR